MLIASLIFIITLTFVIVQPKNIQIGTSAIFGAFIALIFGVVTFSDVLDVTNIVWDATLAFIGIIILSLVLDEIGFFEWAALKMAKFSNGSGLKMFIYSILLGAFVSALFANDGAALILTPILLAKMRILQLNMKTIVAFLLAGGFISDSASLPFVFSNLTNIVTANYFSIGFAQYFFDMIIPFIVSVIASTIFLWLILRKDIPKTVDITLLKEPKSVIKNMKLFYFSWVFLAFLLCAYFLGDAYDLPISIFALGGATIFLIIATISKSVEPLKIIKEAPWQVVWFSIGLYIVVYGLKNAGLTDYLAIILKDLSLRGETIAVLGTGFIAAFLSAIMNNMPTIMIMDIALNDIQNQAMIYANIVGCNLGPKMTPFGSLATLLWLHVLAKKGVKISFAQYSKFGLIITPPVLFIVLLSL
ncbi:arsenic transporter [Aliarcobacter cryaerophilus]|mgnify:FL=1|jgi:arsenical pump membrane protein|uniref:Arsenical pump membrane protein n=1 Tax=Aliarcobacter cryaerophilus TaxID=28198 RepID=A0A1V9VAD6_9BACT|nr:arsenic transporter [Aliarcobacter cryaerophilus]OQA72434.1 MAG: Arsenical pump membrane protein [Candidatus Dependentiae bacterium ADurb.Bin246]MCT7504812.1 arsenic transporter [Aliarcobacter cryaerophilus]MCT7526044.1 arsenic transporter [Aliarcobacter cryaerophilus]MCT7542474.1 arsenic transporter [Aliarcobacter cryaerophilus]OQR40863.1 arsenical efflux pump membrane protein ArsB [Aliarcobacter cryaerophilus]